MNEMKDLIQQAIHRLRFGIDGLGPDPGDEAYADALERLTAGDVALPETHLSEVYNPHTQERQLSETGIAYYGSHWKFVRTLYTHEELIDYGNRRAAAAVLAERERCAVLMESQHTWITNVAASALIRKGTP